MKRYHDDCGGEVNFDDPEEPQWWCPHCQDTVATEDTHVESQWPPDLTDRPNRNVQRSDW